MTQVNYGSVIKSLPVHNKREMFLTVEQVHQLADACPDPARAAVWIALYTGCRRGEVLHRDCTGFFLRYLKVL